LASPSKTLAWCPPNRKHQRRSRRRPNRVLVFSFFASTRTPRLSNPNSEPDTRNPPSGTPYSEPEPETRNRNPKPQFSNTRGEAGEDQTASWCSPSSLLFSSLELIDTQVYEPETRALLGTASHFCQAVVLKLRTVLLLR